MPGTWMGFFYPSISEPLINFTAGRQKRLQTVLNWEKEAD